uniref:Uncharacterized protein n=1 Tax=Ditylenchus dipsaci TaxID=166011 RepID=A0A915CXG7_9BILA
MAFNLAFQVIFFAGSRIIEIILVFYYHLHFPHTPVNSTTVSFNQFSNYKDYQREYSIFFWTDALGSYFTFVSCFSLPGFTLERLLATLFVSDYEINRRVYIAVLLSFLVNLNALLFALIFLYGSFFSVISFFVLTRG